MYHKRKGIHHEHLSGSKRTVIAAFGNQKAVHSQIGARIGRFALDHQKYFIRQEREPRNRNAENAVRRHEYHSP